MVASVVAVGAFVLTPDDFSALGASVISTALFYSNILFFRQSGYFDIETELKPLLHTWSLSVEEQFYLVFPLMMAAAARFRVDLRLVAWGGLIASLIAAALLVRADRTLAFYLAHTRAWELLAGSVVALTAVPAIRSHVAREIAAALGVAMILATILLYDQAALFPGERAILPCLGAVLVIMAGREGRPTLAARILSAPPLVFVGLISYSLYLWHWPIIVLIKYHGGGELSPVQVVLAIAASFGAAVLSWRYVERPFRVASAVPVPRVLAGAGLATAVMVGIGVAGVLAASERGMVKIYGPEIAALQRDARPIGVRPDCVNIAKATLLARGCALGARDPAPSVALLGDSFAGSLVPALDEALGRTGRSALAYIWYSCPSILGTSRTEAAAWAPGFVRDCRAYVEATMAEVAADPAIRFVILSNNYDWYLNRVSTINGEPILTADGAAGTAKTNADAIRGQILWTVERLAAAGKTVIFVGASPTGHVAEGARARLRARMKGDLPPDAAISAADCRDATHDVGLRAGAALGSRFVYIDMLSDFRRPDGEACLMVAGGIPKTSDGSHPTAAVSQGIAARIVAALREGSGN
jgi:peptidoglycan/LPS O-acetylase OafA/YrhL